MRRPQRRARGLDILGSEAVATYHAISAVGQAIVALLKTGRSIPELGNTDIKLFHVRDFQKGLEEGVSVYLYRVTVSGARRNLPPAHSPSGKLYRQPLPVDLYYLVTPWAKTAEMQHLILAWSMRTIEDAPSFPASLLNSYVPDSFRPDETVNLILDTVSVQDMSYIWEVGKSNMQTSATYVARVVAIDSVVEQPEPGPPVQTRAFEAR
jgi:hypothetical protein